MINLKEFKQSVLDKALKGQLTKQNPEKDGTGQELLEKINNKKQKLIKEKKIRKHKALPPVNKDKVPFDIPSNWVWTRLGNIANITTGFSFKKKMYKAKGIRIIRISDFNNNGFLNNYPKYVNDNSKYDKFILKSGDSLMAMTGGSVGKLTPVLKLNKKLFLNQRVADFRTNFISRFYLNYYLQCDYINREISNNKNSTNDNISMTFLKHLVIPLPPLPEQKRIVSKAQTCFKFANLIQKERELGKRFKKEIKQSLLQEAMKGKLTKQLPSDGTADDLLNEIKDKKQKLIKTGKIRKHKALPKISKNEIPFSIPSNWKWTRLGGLCLYMQKGKSSPDYSNNGIPILNQKCIRWHGIDFRYHRYITLKSFKSKYNHNRLLQSNDVLLNSLGTGTIGRSTIVSPKTINNIGRAVVDENIFIIRTGKNINSHFIHEYISIPSVRVHMTGITHGATNQLRMNVSTVLNLLVPLPPLPEQNRIVSVLHQLFSYLD